MELDSFFLVLQSTDSGSAHHNNDTMVYMAPEVYDGNTCLKSDVWSLGISMIEMAESKNPFADCTAYIVMKKVCYEEPPSLSSSGWSSDLNDFVTRCLQKDVDKRASVDDLLKVRITFRYNE